MSGKWIAREKVRWNSWYMIRSWVVFLYRRDGNVRELDIAEESEMEIMVDESDRGGIFIHASGFLQGRYFSNTKQIPVPWDQKTLNIKATPFKDKLEEIGRASCRKREKITEHDILAK